MLPSFDTQVDTLSMHFYFLYCYYYITSNVVYKMVQKVLKVAKYSGKKWKDEKRWCCSILKQTWIQKDTGHFFVCLLIFIFSLISISIFWSLDNVLVWVDARGETVASSVLLPYTNIQCNSDVFTALKPCQLASEALLTSHLTWATAWIQGRCLSFIIYSFNFEFSKWGCSSLLISCPLGLLFIVLVTNFVFHIGWTVVFCQWLHPVTNLQ